MRVNELGTPKKLFFVLLALFLALVYFGPERQEKDVLLSGLVVGVQETEGLMRAFAVESNGQRYVVRVTGQYLQQAAPPALKENQDVDVKVTSFKGVKQGITCELVAVVRAGEVHPPREQADGAPSAPQGNAALPVDDLKGSFGLKGM